MKKKLLNVGFHYFISVIYIYTTEYTTILRLEWWLRNEHERCDEGKEEQKKHHIEEIKCAS